MEIKAIVSCSNKALIIRRYLVQYNNLELPLKEPLHFGIVLLLTRIKRETMPKSGPIIIVEDDVDDQELLKEVFQELEIPNILRFFNSCLEALKYLQTTLERPFLIISDINLPAMTGFDFLKSINNNQRLKEKYIPFIFLTTASTASTIQQAYLMPAKGFFVKPLNGNQLRQTIAAIIEYWKISSIPI